MKHLAICGTIITKDSAFDFIARRAKQFYWDMSMEASAWLSDIERAVVEAGLMSWAEIEEAEKAGMLLAMAA